MRSNDAAALRFLPSQRHHRATFLPHRRDRNLIRRDGISKTVMWKKCASSGELRRCGNVPFERHAGASRGAGLCSFKITTGDGEMRIAQVAPLTEAVPPKLYGGTERVVHWLTEELVALGPRRHAVRQRRFPDLGETRCDLAEGAAPRRRRARSQRAAHGDAGTRPAEMRRRGIRLPAFPSRLLSVLAVFPAADAVPDHAARPARPAGAPAGVHDFLVGPGDFDLERATASGAAGQLGPHHPSRPARESC